MSVTVNVLYLPGTNCQRETLRAFRSVGAAPRNLFLSDVLAGRERLDGSDILCIPGGFSYGDHLGAGRVAALLLRTRLDVQLESCRRRPLLCICNGFQIGVRAGFFGSGVALGANVSGVFTDVPEQAHVVDSENPSPWLDGLRGETVVFPCAHGEGRFTYVHEDGWRSALRYPAGANPDGSAGDLAGITSEDGLVLGMMNHPERAQSRELNALFFENGVRMAR